MEEALKIIVSKSPAAGSQAMQCLRALAVKSPIVQERFNRVVEIALGDPQAEFTPADRALIAEFVGGASDDVRSLDVRIRVNRQEKSTIQEMADDAGMTVSDFIRERIGL